jgi:hypothetical protein
MDYYQKYFKYKQKYLDLKGGVMRDWIQINNSGQQNCGIFINNSRPNEIMKCEYGDKRYNIYLEKLHHRSVIDVFPKIIKTEYKKNENKTYTIMDKLDGDLTQLFCEVIPKLIINKITSDKDMQKNILSLFSYKVRQSWNDDGANFYYLENDQLQNIIDGKDTDSKYYKKILDLKKSNNITFKIYNDFMQQLFYHFDFIYSKILKKIIGKLYRLYQVNFEYNDFKFDNFGYKFKSGCNENNILMNIDCIDIYIIDWGSGLDDSDGYATLNKIIDIINGEIVFAKYGEGNFKDINSPIIRDEQIDLLKKILSDDLIKILLSKYEYNIPKNTKLSKIIIEEIKKVENSIILFTKI